MSTPAPRSSHPYCMYDAIYAQPGALRLVTRGNESALAEAARRLASLDRLLVTGVGTSWHAALAGEHLLALAGARGPRVRAVHAFELLGYGPSVDAGTGVVAISHRGDTGALRAVLRDGRAAVRVVLTGKGSELTGDVTLHTVGLESSSTHTVSYTSTLAMLATLAAEMGSDAGLRRALGEIPDHLATLLGQESWEELAGRFATEGRYWIVGAGPSIATAYEGALKIQEAAHATALGVQCEQFLHGPWTALDPGDVVVVIAPPGPSYPRCLDAARVAREVGAPVLALVEDGDTEIAKIATETIVIAPVPELLSPLLTVVPLQLLAYHTALRRGMNPDVLRANEPAYARARAAFSL
jgi:glutamine---fructose-6-phosphate transaminase (isomerizing)